MDLRHFYKFMIFWWICGIVTGIILGITFKFTLTVNIRVVHLAGFVGNLFVRMMDSIYLILVVTCIITAITILPSDHFKEALAQFFLSFIVLKILGCLIALGLALAFVQTVSSKSESHSFSRISNFLPSTAILNRSIERKAKEDNYLDILRNMVPRNVIIEMFILSHETKLYPDNSTRDLRKLKIQPPETMVDRLNVIGIMAFSVAIGFALRNVGEIGQSAIDVVYSARELGVVLMNWALATAPLCFASMFCKEILALPTKELKDIAIYMVAVLLFYIILFLIVYPTLYMIATRRSPLKLFNLNIFGTSLITGSSLTCLPIATKYFNEDLGFDERLVSFVLNLGININKDASAGTYVIACAFVHKWGKDLPADLKVTGFDYVDMIILSIIGSIVTPGVPYGTIVVLRHIIQENKLPLGPVLLVYSVEWILERFCALVNVYGNCFILGTIQHYYENMYLDEPEKEETEEAPIAAE